MLLDFDPAGDSCHSQPFRLHPDNLHRAGPARQAGRTGITGAIQSCAWLHLILDGATITWT
jgi:hypothetical protein